MGFLGKVLLRSGKLHRLPALFGSVCSSSHNQSVRQYHLLVQRNRLQQCRTAIPASKRHGIQRDQRRSVSKSVYFNYMSPDVLPIGSAISLMDTIHSSIGVPWWLTIAVTTITLRTIVTLPLHIYSMHNQAKLDQLSAIFNDKAKDLAKEIQMAKQMEEYKHWNDKEAKRQFNRNMKRIVEEERLKENVHPAKGAVVALVQVPLWVSMSLALRNMSGSLQVTGLELPVMYPDLATQGALWFPNLLLPDVTLIIPAVMTLSNLIIIEMFNLKTATQPRSQKIISYGLRFLVICIMPPIAASLPTCVSFYWMCSSLFGLTQNIVLRLPKVRRKIGIPQLPSESQRPFMDMWEVAKKKYSIRNIRNKGGSSEKE